MPTWKTYRRYLERNGWECYRESSHYHYRKIINGVSFRTRASHGNKEIPASIWRSILKHELKITQEEFNAGL